MTPDAAIWYAIAFVLVAVGVLILVFAWTIWDAFR